MPPAALTTWQCPSCRGVYPDPQGNGQRYYHVCPPLSRLELLALAPGELAALYTAHGINPLVPDALDELARVGVPRVNHRDENIDPAYRGEILAPGQTPEEETVPRIAWGAGRLVR